MTRNVILNAIVYDTATVRPGQLKVSFFHDRPGSTADDTTWSEPTLVDWLTTEEQPSKLLSRTLGLALSNDSARRVVHPFLENSYGKPGDIDLLICECGFPHRAVAIEWKRVRVRAGEGPQRVNRLEALANAPVQANGLRKLGFHQTYLGVIAVVHDPSDAAYNFASRGLRESTFSRLIHFTEALPLDSDVGIVYVEIAQPIRESISTSGVVCAGVLRNARRVEQTVDLTSRVENFFRSDRLIATPNSPHAL